jgi:predicted dehydrogenase
VEKRFSTRGRVRLGVVGAGTITQSVHLPVVNRLGGLLQLVAVHDLSAARTAEVAAAYGARACGTAEEVLTAPDVDAVLLATPGSHPALARAALQAGKHVLAEKPLCLTVAEADELAELAAQRGRVLQVGYMKMWDPAVRAAATELAALAAPTVVRVTVLHPADAAQVGHLRMTPHADVDPAVVEGARAEDVAAARRAVGEDADPELLRWYAGVLNGSVIHELSLLRALGIALPERFDSCDVWTAADGEPASVVATGRAGSARLTLTWLWLPDHPGYREEVAVFTRDGQVRLDVAPPYLVDATSTLHVEGPAVGVHRSTTVVDAWASGFVAQWEAFASAVTGGGDLAGADAAGAAADLRCLQVLASRGPAERGWKVGGEASTR